MAEMSFPQHLRELLGKSFHQAVHGQPVSTKVNYTPLHQHPRVDPQVRKQETEKIEQPIQEYDLHKAQLETKIRYRNSDYNEMLAIASTLESYVPDEVERLRLAATLLKQTKSRFTSVDIQGAIDTHIDEIETHQRLVNLNSPKSLVQQRIENLNNEVETLKRDISDRKDKIADYQHQIVCETEQLEHNTALITKLVDDIKEAQKDMKTPLDEAVNDIKSNLLKVKAILNDH